jgi:hypothetical protein
MNTTPSASLAVRRPRRSILSGDLLPFAAESPGDHVPSWMLADDFDGAHDLRSLLTGLPARPGTIR